MKKLAFFSILSLWIYSLNAQTFCYTSQSSSNNGALSSSSFRIGNTCTVTLRVYIHVIRRSDGTDGQSTSDVTQAMGFLNSDFNPHGIYFQQQGNIDYIDDDFYFGGPTLAIFNVNNHSDGIDIYMFDDEISTPGGAANGVGESSEFWISGEYWDPPYGSLVKSHVISHEMGHVLFLWHTFHGTSQEGTDPFQCAELVDGSNSTTCGDYVSDTPADPDMDFDVNLSNCTWNGCKWR